MKRIKLIIKNIKHSYRDTCVGMNAFIFIKIEHWKFSWDQHFAHGKCLV